MLLPRSEEGQKTRLVRMESWGQFTPWLLTNIDFEAWGEYLGDPPLAMALLDRIVDGAIILKIAGQSYRAHRAKPGKADTSPHE